MTKDNFVINNKDADHQKRRGGYYTPSRICDYVCEWAILNEGSTILEPSAGDGNFVESALRVAKSKEKQVEITAVEIEKDEILKAKKRCESLVDESKVNYILGDFFEVYDNLKSQRFDIVLGNPPFIRYQYFEDTSREKAFSNLSSVGYSPNKLTNAWVAFIELSIELIKENGKLAVVVPAELLQVNYAHELRKNLTKHFKHIVIIGFRKIVFPEIQQEVVLLLAEGKKDSNGFLSDIQTIEFDDGIDLLKNGKDLNQTIRHIPSKHTRNGMKWTALYLSEKAYKALDEAEQHTNLFQLGHYADVNVGIVTGQNSFFVVDNEMRKEIKDDDFLLPIVGKTSALNSIVFSEDDYVLYQNKYPASLLNLSNIPAEKFPEVLKEYLSYGELIGVDKGYKCRIRPRWYDVPSVYIPDGFLYRQIHKFPMLVINHARVTSTDTIHRVRFKMPIEKEKFAACFLNSLTLAWSEVAGRSYGGGVLELEPREAIKLPIPYSDDLLIDTDKVRELSRKKKESEILDYVDQIVLRDYLGFSKQTTTDLRLAWTELRNRRVNRRLS
jgi:adenine-specific DNA-methyltransferase